VIVITRPVCGTNGHSHSHSGWRLGSHINDSSYLKHFVSSIVTLKALVISTEVFIIPCMCCSWVVRDYHRVTYGNDGSSAV
jgi:hypothetical protein